MLSISMIVTMVALGTTVVNAQPIVTSDIKSSEKTNNSNEIRDLSETPVKTPSEKIPVFQPIEIEEFKQIALQDYRVLDAIGEKEAEFRKAGYITYGENSEKYPVLHFVTNDSAISVRLNADTKEVEYVSERPHRIMDTNGIASAYYDGAQTLNGLQMRLDAPTYSHESGASWTAILLNAVKSGSNTNLICDSNSHPNHYWAQGGLMFDTDDTDAVWTDTLEDCIGQDSTLGLSDGDEIRVRIWINDYVSDTDEVVIELQNTDSNPLETYTVTTDVANTSTLLTGDPNTSVFFENNNGDHVSPTWEDGFTDGDLVVTNAHYRKTSSSSWWFWDGQSEAKQCGHTVTTGDLISGSFDTSPRTVTWDLSDMRSKCDAY